MTINQACASGLQSVALGAQSILLGQSRIVVSGGIESMSRMPYLVDSEDAQNVAAYIAATAGHG